MMSVDCCIIGATAAGVTAAVVLARAGHSVVLVASGQALGGALPSLGAIETHYAGSRSRLLDEFRERIIRYYTDTYGAGSPQLADCVGLDPENPMLTFEPSVASRVLEDLVAEAGVVTVRAHELDSVTVLDGHLDGVTLRDAAANLTIVAARTFIDATDEGDLAAAAGVPTRVGRESNAEYGESHAGRIFTRRITGLFPVDAAEGRLDLIPKRWTTQGPLPGSTGEGDGAVQDYSYRLCLTDDPANRLDVERPEGYDRRDFEAVALRPEQVESTRSPLHHRWLTKSVQDMIAEDHIIHGHPLPNRKRSWNATNLTGVGARYAESTTHERQQLADRYLRHALGLLYFLQNDEALPEGVRMLAREWGLAADEFAATDNVPEYLYVREARRIVAGTVFTEHDCLLAPGIERAPIHARSVAITEFPLDSLGCTTERLPGSLPDGQFFLMEETRPGQVPFDVMITPLPNLLVPVCCSVTHVAWGTIRQTPTQMQLAEAAAHACMIALDEGGVPADVDVRVLQRELVRAGSLVSFFNDLDMSSTEPWLEAVQHLGTRGFFRSYDARGDEPLTIATATAWAAILRAQPPLEPTIAASSLPSDEADRADNLVCTRDDIARLLGVSGDSTTRGDVALLVARSQSDGSSG